MDKKILFIGDSFVDNFIYGYGPDDLNLSNSTVGHFWNENGCSPFFLGASSRDTQTILDTWIKYIPSLNSDDLLVIFLPWFGRVRLPNKEYKITYPNSIIPPFHEYFTGNRSYNKKNHFLEIWGNEYNYEYFWNKLEIQELINDSKASILNYTEIVDSLCKLTPCKKIVHCWDYKKFDSDNIIYREEMTELIGKWETSEETITIFPDFLRRTVAFSNPKISDYQIIKRKRMAMDVFDHLNRKL